MPSPNLISSTEESAGFDSPRQLVGTVFPLEAVPAFIDMRQTRWPWWENAIRVNPLHWRNAIMDDLKFTSFCPPFLADLESESFEDSAAQLAEGFVLVPNSRGAIVKIDTDDAKRVLALRWQVYRAENAMHCMHCRRQGGVVENIRLHRFVMDAQPGQIVDHINGDRLDNRKSNLRIVTPAQNCQNQARQRRAMQSPFKGVCRASGTARWRSYILHQGKQRHLGVFSSEAEAAQAYDAAAREVFGAYAALNFPMPHEQSVFRKEAQSAPTREVRDA